MTDLSIQYTEKMVGANHPTLSDTLNRLTLVEHNNDGTHNKLTKITDPWVDVRAYGAVGDGVTDDTAAIQAALTAAAGKTLLFPVGTYMHSSLLLIPSNITVSGYGATIKAANAISKTIGGLSVTGKTNVQIFGLTYDGNRAGRAPGAPVGSAHGFSITNSSNIVLRDIGAKNGVADGLLIAYSNSADANTRTFNVQVYGGRYTNCFRNNVSVVGGVNIKFYGSRFDTANGTAPKTGVDVEADNATICNEDVEFYGCTADSNSGSGFAITNNSKRCKIHGGASKDNSLHGIDMSQPANVDALVEGVAVTGNGSAGAGFYGIYSSATRAQIINNKVHSNANEGIYLSGSSSFNKIAGNTVYGNTQGIYALGGNNELYDNNSYDNTSLTGWNIYIAGNNGRIQRNKSVNSLGSGGSYGMSINSSTNVVCTDNVVTGAQNNGGLQIIGGANASVWRDNIDGSGAAVDTPIKRHLSATATLNFSAPASVPGSVDLTITVTGAALGDTVTVGSPITVGANYILTGFVSAVNTVTVRWTQISGAAADPDSTGGTYRVDVWKH